MVDTENLSLQGTVLASIKQYENMLAETKDPIAKSSLSALLKSLKKQLVKMPKHISSWWTSNTHLEDKWLKNVKEIFYFYTKQHCPAGVAFEDFQRIMKEMDWVEFTAFCKDFGVKLERSVIYKVFNQNS